MDTSNQRNERPWGNFVVLDSADTYKVKRIEVLPGHRLSYQRHQGRSEHWMIVEGSAKVTIDNSELSLSVGDVIDIAIGSAHRIGNSGRDTLVFIEIQRGKFLSEDDVERIEDDYGRLNQT